MIFSPKSSAHASAVARRHGLARLDQWGIAILTECFRILSESPAMVTLRAKDCQFPHGRRYIREYFPERTIPFPAIWRLDFRRCCRGTTLEEAGIFLGERHCRYRSVRYFTLYLVRKLCRGRWNTCDIWSCHYRMDRFDSIDSQDQQRFWLALLALSRDWHKPRANPCICASSCAVHSASDPNLSRPKYRRGIRDFYWPRTRRDPLLRWNPDIFAVAPTSTKKPS